MANAGGRKWARQLFKLVIFPPDLVVFFAILVIFPPDLVTFSLNLASSHQIS